MGKTAKWIFMVMALILSVVMVWPAAAQAAKGSCGGEGDGENLQWTLHDGLLSITGTGAMADYDIYFPPPWYYYSSLESLSIGNGVTSIGNYAFYCSDFTGSLTIPNSVTSIGDGAFDGCSGFTGSLTIPDSVTSIGNGAFSRCRISSFSVATDNQHYCNDSYGVLFNRDMTTLVQYPGGNTRTSYTIPNSVTRIGDEAFRECSGFTGSLTIPNSVTSIGDGAFAFCDGFTGSL
ncbi:MAG: leucine-rich repeat domain-containing protein, partial [Syntrophomonadaceae bacterium]|nr:leucine-rich repeat domain-containing protein [Syntrophomonadaceae bacterium]